MRHKRTLTARTYYYKKYVHVRDFYYRIKNKNGIKFQCGNDYYLAVRIVCKHIPKNKWHWYCGNRFYLDIS